MQASPRSQHRGAFLEPFNLAPKFLLFAPSFSENQPLFVEHPSVSRPLFVEFLSISRQLLSENLLFSPLAHTRQRCAFYALS